MNRRSFLLSSIGGLVAASVLPKLEPAAATQVACPPTEEAIVEVLRIDGVWREVSFRVLSKGDLFRRKLADGTLLDEGQVWRALSNACRPANCSCVSQMTGLPLVTDSRRSDIGCTEPWQIEVEPADPAHVAAGEAARDAPFVPPNIALSGNVYWNSPKLFS